MNQQLEDEAIPHDFFGYTAFNMDGNSDSDIEDLNSEECIGNCYEADFTNDEVKKPNQIEI